MTAVFREALPYKAQVILTTCLSGGEPTSALIFLSKSGHKESDEYNHFWRCSIWERTAGNIQKSLKLKTLIIETHLLNHK